MTAATDPDDMHEAAEKDTALPGSASWFVKSTVHDSGSDALLRPTRAGPAPPRSAVSVWAGRNECRCNKQSDQPPLSWDIAPIPRPCGHHAGGRHNEANHIHHCPTGQFRNCVEFLPFLVPHHALILGSLFICRYRATVAERPTRSALTRHKRAVVAASYEDLLVFLDSRSAKNCPVRPSAAGELAR